MADKGMLIRIAANIEELKRNLADGTATINTTTAAMSKLATSLEGNKLIQNAQNIVAAVDKIGGVTKLTEAEKARLNATLDKAIEKYQALGREAPQAMRDLAEATRSTQTATELFQERWAAFTAAAGAAVIGIRSAVTALDDLLAASSAQENALVRLETALRAQNTYTPALSQQYQDLAASFQQTTVFADELVNEAQALLVQIGNVMPSQMREALTAATDLAAGLRIDLLTATQLVGKAFAGETGTLKRYGIVIDEAKLAAGGATAVLEAINEKFGGQAAAQAATYTGQIRQLANQYSDVKEQAGQLLAQAILPLLKAFTSLSPETQLVISSAVILGTVIGPVALGFTGLVTAVNLLLPVLAVALPAAIGTVSALLGPGALLIAGILAVVAVWRNWDQITAIAKAVYDGVKTWLVDRFDAIVQWVKQKIDAVTGFFKGMYDAVVGRSYVPDMVARIGAEFATLDAVMVQPALAANDAVSGGFEAMAASVGQTVSAVSQQVTSAVSTWSEAMSAVRAGLGTLSGTVQSSQSLAQLHAAARTAGGTVNYDAYNNPYIYVPGVNAPGSPTPRAEGGPVSSGAPYVVGERGPELFVPRTAGTIVPNGGGSTTITIASGAVVLNYPFMNDPRARTEIAAMVGDALMARLRASGLRVPSGA